MRWTSILAIYSLFWVLSAFLVLPFGVRTHDEAGLDKSYQLHREAYVRIFDRLGGPDPLDHGRPSADHSVHTVDRDDSKVEL